MKIRSATADDETAVTALWKECGLTVPYNDPAADFRFALGKPNSDILVTEDICGAVLVGHDGHRGWLYYLAVAPARQRQGVGRMLVSAAEQWLAERGVPKVHLMVRETNSAVAAFYQRLGFDLMPRINMQKWLKP
jgi:ribosomal protein S18 acetylase RimI-like enzyme